MKIKKTTKFGEETQILKDQNIKPEMEYKKGLK